MNIGFFTNIVDVGIKDNICLHILNLLNLFDQLLLLGQLGHDFRGQEVQQFLPVEADALDYLFETVEVGCFVLEVVGQIVEGHPIRCLVF